ncbi:hypothetical protein NF212_13905 [Parasalinivibrio latis]|uniref:hypothetical protein n=1 Tax=Parasalinivibrio latis TaxID=2952610 RepID=UPI0030E017CE
MNGLRRWLPILVLITTALLIGSLAGRVLLPVQFAESGSSQLKDHDVNLSIAPEREYVRVHYPRILLPTEPEIQESNLPEWPVVLQLVLAGVLSLSLFARMPRRYLESASHRLGGWRESNLQYRFIQSR